MKPITIDLHVHTCLSRCAKSEATVDSYIAAAEKQGLKTICFTNHCWATQMPGMNDWYKGQDIDHVMKIKEQIPKDTKGIRILVGCETEYIGNGIAGLNRELAECFDFVLIPANHFHMKGFTVPRDLGSGGPKEVSELLYRRFMEAACLGFGTAIAHPFIPLGFSEHEGYPPGWEADILNGISDTMYENCFRAAASAGLAIEINIDTLLRPAANISALYSGIYTIARECGCKFTFGSDAHHPDNMTGYEKAKEFAEACGITDDQVFVV